MLRPHDTRTPTQSKTRCYLTPGTVVALIDRVVAAALGGMTPLPLPDWAGIELSDTLAASMVDAAHDRAMTVAAESAASPLPPAIDDWDFDDAAFRSSFCSSSPPPHPASSAFASPPRHTKKRGRSPTPSVGGDAFPTAKRLLRLQADNADDDNDDGAPPLFFHGNEDGCDDGAAAAASPPYGLLGLSDTTTTTTAYY